MQSTLQSSSSAPHLTPSFYFWVNPHFPTIAAWILCHNLGRTQARLVPKASSGKPLCMSHLTQSAVIKLSYLLLSFAEIQGCFESWITVFGQAPVRAQIAAWRAGHQGTIFSQLCSQPLIRHFPWELQDAIYTRESPGLSGREDTHGILDACAFHFLIQT